LHPQTPKNQLKLERYMNKSIQLIAENHNIYSQNFKLAENSKNQIETSIMMLVGFQNLFIA